MNARTVVTDAELAQAQRELGWTEIRTRVMRLLYNGGFSAAQVACLIGGATRNAVLGKIDRDGLAAPGRQPPARSNKFAAGMRRVRSQRPPKPPRELVATPRAARIAPPPPPHIVDAAIPIEQRRSLLELTKSCCRWPVGDPLQPDFFYCGAVAERKDPLDPDSLFHPYCASHMRRAHQPWQRRRGGEHPKSKLQIEEGAHARRL